MLQNFSNSVVSKLFIVSKLYYFHSFKTPFSVFFVQILFCLALIWFKVLLGFVYRKCLKKFMFVSSPPFSLKSRNVWNWTNSPMIRICLVYFGDDKFLLNSFIEGSQFQLNGWSNVSFQMDHEINFLVPH